MEEVEHSDCQWRKILSCRTHTIDGATLRATTGLDETEGGAHVETNDIKLTNHYGTIIIDIAYLIVLVRFLMLPVVGRRSIQVRLSVSEQSSSAHQLNSSVR